MCALNASDFTSEPDASCIYVILPLMAACANPENNFRYWMLLVALRRNTSRGAWGLRHLNVKRVTDMVTGHAQQGRRV